MTTSTANPLVAGPENTSSPLGGTMLLESLGDLSQALESGSWLEIGLATFSTAMDTAAAVMDPLGQLFAAGLGWLMEHMEPLKGWLNDLTGDAGAVAGFAATWGNVKAALAAAADELDRVVQADLAGMSGAAVAAYTRYAGDLGAHVRAVSGTAGGVATALRVCSTVVQVVHDLVRDALAELVGAAISWAAEIALTVGLGTPWVVSQVTTRVSSLATRVGTKVTEVIKSARSLKKLVESIKEALADLAKALRNAKPGSAHTPSTHSPDVPRMSGATYRRRPKSAAERSSWQPALPLEMAFIESITFEDAKEGNPPKIQAVSEPAAPSRSTVEKPIPPSGAVKEARTEAVPAREMKSEDARLNQLLDKNWELVLRRVREQNANLYGLVNSVRGFPYCFNSMQSVTRLI